MELSYNWRKNVTLSEVNIWNNLPYHIIGIRTSPPGQLPPGELPPMKLPPWLLPPGHLSLKSPPRWTITPWTIASQSNCSLDLPPDVFARIIPPWTTTPGQLLPIKFLSGQLLTDLCPGQLPLNKLYMEFEKNHCLHTPV